MGRWNKLGLGGARWIAAVFSAGLWAACNQVAGIEDGKSYPDACLTDGDCVVEEPLCRSAKCIEERCAYEDELDGTPVQQEAGDCVDKECDGRGRIRVIPVETDVPNDENDCTLDYCDGITPAHKPLSFGPCYEGKAGTLGKGICAAGMKACDENGQPISSCSGQILPKEKEDCLTLFDDDCDGNVNDKGLGCACVPGTTADCFAGPEAALGHGPCAMGKQTCNDDGTGYGACAGNVPATEVCSPIGVDEDCDGRVDEEGDDCACGDGVVSNMESCDDGNTNDNDGCTHLCALPSCGNGVVEGDEACDDGNTQDTDACTVQCKTASCGDGLLWVGVEQCDDGNTRDTDACTTSKCENAACGDGIVRKGVEECDEGPVATATCLDGCLGAPVDIFSKGVYPDWGGFTCVLFTGGRAKCWGWNQYAELGNFDLLNRGDGIDEMGDKLPFLPLGAGRVIGSLAPGAFFGCGLLDGGSVKCWGSCLFGQCGLGDTSNRGDQKGEMGDELPEVDLGTGRTAKRIGSGKFHTCALLDNDTLKCWGNNAYGELGQNDNIPRGFISGQMGDKLDPIKLGTFKIATSFSAGQDFTCAVLKDLLLNQSLVKCWGYNGWGQLGLGDTAPRGYLAGEMGDALPPVDLGDVGAIQQVALAYGHACALLSGGKVKCWGANDRGQLGLGDTNARGDATGEMGTALPFVDLGTNKTAVFVATGANSSCAILSDGTVKCWGQNDRGQLGLGDKANRGDGSNEMGDLLPAIDFGAGRKVEKIAVGNDFSCALLDDATVKCWGRNDVGQLGLGDTLDRGDGPGEMGDNLPAVKLR